MGTKPSKMSHGTSLSEAKRPARSTTLTVRPTPGAGSPMGHPESLPAALTAPATPPPTTPAVLPPAAGPAPPMGTEPTCHGHPTGPPPAAAAQRALPIPAPSSSSGIYDKTSCVPSSHPQCQIKVWDEICKCGADE